MSLSATTISSTPPSPTPHPQSKPLSSVQRALLRNAIIGFADGLTVPFALTAGLSSLGSPRLVILAGLAELFSGAISMGLGAYLAAVTEKKQSKVETEKLRREIADSESDKIKGRVCKALEEGFGMREESAKSVWEGMRGTEKEGDGESCVRLLMMVENGGATDGVEGMVWVEGLVMSLAYFVGGLLPMIPYFAFKVVNHALFTSIAITAVILLIFGYVKAAVTGLSRIDAFLSAGHTLLTGATAAAVSYGIVRGVNSAHSFP